MKKLIALAFVLALVCVLCLVACNKQAPAPKMTNEIYTGEITEITDTTITIFTNRVITDDAIVIISNGAEIRFSITKLVTIDMPPDLLVGDVVTVETAYMVGTDEPYPAIGIVRVEGSSIK